MRLSSRYRFSVKNWWAIGTSAWLFFFLIAVFFAVGFGLRGLADLLQLWLALPGLVLGLALDGDGFFALLGMILFVMAWFPVLAAPFGLFERIYEE